MVPIFTPKHTDEQVNSFYPSGKIQEEKYFNNGIPSNGWSRKTFHENGVIQLAECYSHSLIIEQLLYDQAGILIAHKIYSHKQKQLIDKPTQTAVQRHNVVSGCAHMGYYFKHLPAISKFIEAEYDEAALDKAYQDFIRTSSPHKEWNPSNDEINDDIVSWSLQGRDMRFIIGFEQGEGYYQWNLRAKDEAGYEQARLFMESLD